MKKAIFLLTILGSTILSAQKILDTTLIDIPFIGKNGGAHLLNWTLDEAKDNIYFNAYSHINGSQIVTNEKEINETKEAYNEKSFFGKLLSSIGPDNRYDNTVIPVAYEKVINASTLSSVSSKEVLFHKIDQLPKDKNVYFKKSSGMIDLDQPFKTGRKIEYHYRDLNTPLKYAPPLEKDILRATYIEMHGEGLLGFKNMKPKLIKKRGFFTYDNSRGYMSKTETTDIANLSNLDDLKGYDFVENTDQTFDKKYFSWFVKEDDLSKYKLAIFDEEGTLTVKTFDFEAPRKLKVHNKGVYTKNLELKGVINIFGYHRKGKKMKHIYPVNKFDLIYMDASGEMLMNTKIDYGTEKAYRNVLSPIMVFEKDDQKLQFINNHVLSLIKSNYEKFDLNKTGKTTLISSTKYYEVRDGQKINYYNYLSDFDRIDKFGDHYVVRKVITDKIDVPSTNPNGSASVEKKETDSQINFTILDDNLNPVDFASFTINPKIIGQVRFQTIENTAAEIVMAAKKGNEHYMIKINQTSSNPKIEFFNLDIPYKKASAPTLYFASFNQNYALVHKKDRCIYVMNQFYDNKNYGTKVLDKIGITKIGY